VCNTKNEFVEAEAEAEDEGGMDAHGEAVDATGEVAVKRDAVHGACDGAGQEADMRGHWPGVGAYECLDSAEAATDDTFYADNDATIESPAHDEINEGDEEDGEKNRRNMIIKKRSSPLFGSLFL
jgi:hypothetical protein